jgi:hypothetical protein
MVYRDTSSSESREISPSTPSSSESSTSPFSGIRHSNHHHNNNNNSSKRKILSKPLLSCAICGGKTKCRHFGAVSCNACAAFFRRTIAEKRKYSCMQKENCVLLSNLVRRMCRFCRFKKCIEAGMQEDEVLSLGSSTNTSNNTSPPSNINTNAYTNTNSSITPPTTTSTALMPLNANNINGKYEVSKLSMRTKEHKQKSTILKFSFSSLPGISNDILRNLLYCYESVVPNRLSISPKVTLDTDKASLMPDSYNQISNEAKVFWSFYKSSGLSQYVKENHVQESVVDLAFGWNVMQVMHNTVKFDGISQKRLYFIDHTYLSITEAGLTSWYASDPEVARDSNCMVRLGSPMWHRVFDACNQLKNAHFNNIEMACFFALVMSSSIIHNSSNNIETRKLIQPYTNQIFRGLSQYYDENFTSDEMACKVGRIVMMLSLYTEIHNLMNDHRQQLVLCGKKLQYHELLNTCKTY